MNEFTPFWVWLAVVSVWSFGLMLVFNLMELKQALYWFVTILLLCFLVACVLATIQFICFWEVWPCLPQ